MAASNGLVIGVVGRYGSEVAQPFVPQVACVGITLSRAARDAAIDALQSAFESTPPWAESGILVRAAEERLARALADRGFADVEVQVTVVDNIPFRVP